MRNPSTADLLRQYIRAKDENRPRIMADAFLPDATLNMKLSTTAVAFPSETQGVEGIADVLSRTFGTRFDNVYTFYLDHPGRDTRRDTFACDWLVAMTQKDDNTLRVGCGGYVWHMQAEPHRVARLDIDIDAMVVLEPGLTDQVFDWIERLPYPWTAARTVLGHAPDIAALAPVLQRIEAGLQNPVARA